MVDCQLIGEVDMKKLPLYILAAYFVFNIQYIKGCSNLFGYLETLLLERNLKRQQFQLNIL